MCPSSERLPVKISDRRWGDSSARIRSCLIPKIRKISTDTATSGINRPPMLTQQDTHTAWTQIVQSPGIPPNIAI